MGQILDDAFYTITSGQLAGIQHEPMDGPRFVVAVLNALPIRQIETDDIALAGLYPAPVFGLV
jgi:hypothetical protein